MNKAKTKGFATKKVGEKTKPSFSLKGFIIRNKGFVIAVAAVIVIIAALIFVQYSPEESQEKAVYSLGLFQQNQSDLNIYLQMVILDQNDASGTTLDDDFLASTKTDIEWLIAKEKSIFNSKPNGYLFAKEIAYSLFAQQIILTNTEYAQNVDKDDQNNIIMQGLAVNFSTPKLLSQEELDSTFSTAGEKEAYFDTLKELYSEYVNSKKQFINTIESKERKYVEAKKLVLLQTYSMESAYPVYADSNTAETS